MAVGRFLPVFKLTCYISRGSLFYGTCQVLLVTEDRTLITSLGQGKEVGKWVPCGTQVVPLRAEEVTREERQSNQREGTSQERWGM